MSEPFNPSTLPKEAWKSFKTELPEIGTTIVCKTSSGRISPEFQYQGPSTTHQYLGKVFTQWFPVPQQ
jgi:hypothetical protein